MAAILEWLVFVTQNFDLLPPSPAYPRSGKYDKGRTREDFHFRSAVSFNTNASPDTASAHVGKWAPQKA